MRDGRSRSSRIRKRHRCALETWRGTCSVIAILNSMDRGKSGLTTELVKDSRVIVDGTPLSPLHLGLHARIAKESYRLARWRGIDRCTGVQAAAKLAKSSPSALYGLHAHRVPHAVLRASLVDEPLSDKRVLMLEALPRDESLYYAEESHVVREGASSEALFADITEHYTFVGGSQAEYLKYLHRSHPKGMWAWATSDQVRATCGFSVVEKKPKDNVVRLRKLLMCCPANYCLEDVRPRDDLGLYGGGLLSKLLLPAGGVAGACFDQTSAFSYIEVPDWLFFWQCCPPVRCSSVWSLLPQEIRANVQPYHFIFPRYRRLAMGFSHSVRI